MSKRFTYYGSTTSTPYFVDTFLPDAMFSFFKVSSTSTLCIRIRRDSDDAELDIGFSGGVVDVAAIASFCGVANGWTVTEYDQSGNGRHVTQSVLSRQPKIYNGSNVYTVTEGYYAFNMTTGLAWLDYSNPNQNTLPEVTVISVNTRGVVNANNRPAGFREDPSSGAVKSTMAQTQDGTLRYDGAASTVGTVTLPATDLYLRSSFKTNTNQYDYVNGVNSITNTVTLDNTSESFSIGNAVGAQGSPCFSGAMCETIFFHSNRLTDLVAMENEIKSRYTSLP